MKNKIMHDTKWNIIDFVTSFIITFINIKVLTNGLGIEGYGFYSLFIGLIATFGLVDIGMGMAVSKYLSEFIGEKKYKDVNQVIEIGILFYLTLGIIVLIITIIFKENIINFLNLSGFYYKLGLKLIVLLPILMTLNFIIQILNNILVAFEKWKIISKINIIFKVINFLGILYIMFNLKQKILKIFVLILNIFIVKLIVSIIIIKRNYNFFELTKIRKNLFFKIINFLKYSLLQYLFSILLGHLDNLIIAKFINLKTVGVYQISLKVMNYLYSFLINIFKIIFPKISKMHGKKNLFKINQYIKKNLFICETISIVLSLFTIVTWKFFIGAYLGSKIANSTYIYILVFLVFLIIRAPEVIYYYYFNAIARPKVFAYSSVIEGFSNFALYILLIPKYGALGIILGHIISKLFGVIFFFIYSKKLKEY
ncbi:hypothetical protein OSSY52_03630 [Tepiditoga spiralis]|uniref:Polysaccharide biosynthesis protein C-terminal domain-containing protein n=1 Tax=Tepiditoga spiralis TaxID=2108365 RepID=A0A7G1G872_9BACT|nr:MATE family efflux transporter [Tepiditoga spiralis]BBE30222.1 hypothetical protein OSSY52_03630 [Tepiditoga spiralis]